jgi:hypothetical protein
MMRVLLRTRRALEALMESYMQRTPKPYIKVMERIAIIKQFIVLFLLRRIIACPSRILRQASCMCTVDLSTGTPAEIISAERIGCSPDYAARQQRTFRVVIIEKLISCSN